MKQQLAMVSILIRDYDEAIEFYTEKMGFNLIEDSKLDDDKRWVVLRPKGHSQTSLLLAKASGMDQLNSVGNQGGGRVFLFLHTDDFWRDFKQMTSAGVQFKEAPRSEAYGTVAVFEDLYGNRWDLLEPGTA
ncbi:MAG: VOC family protein [Flavobacteriaceae bacterium]